MISFQLNNRAVSAASSEDTPLLWVLRDELRLMGTKFGCGAGLCGACTVIVDGRAIRSCVLPLAAVEGSSVTTIEGLGGDHPVQRAWIAHEVAQCGYCQSGQIMSAVALLQDQPAPSEAQIKSAMAGNICRCGSYPQILQAITAASENIGGETAGVEYYQPGTDEGGEG